ncbi:TadE family type IV pilus minor pilin [Kribbella speibonae]|uniref:TadE-like domain-containing protein n=1 Tax=Kribbella speibonae TaxID=1572660 RepID=A0A4R0IEZ6_9ACTN|nr:TadE family type IV pilus minor pilin [Kribbella speibonae]TCC31821.1 hypothetical protein E0H92_35410 [Kribbella speibonae]
MPHHRASTPPQTPTAQPTAPRPALTITHATRPDHSGKTKPATRPDHAGKAKPATQAEPATAANLAARADDATRGGPVTRGGRASRAGPVVRAGRGVRGQGGAVTAEMALALPVLVSLLLLGIWSVGLVVLNIRCIDAARDVARAVARGESVDQAKAIGHRTVPAGTIVIHRDASDIQVTVTATPAHKPPLLAFLSPTRLTATATLQAEPDTP